MTDEQLKKYAHGLGFDVERKGMPDSNGGLREETDEELRSRVKAIYATRPLVPGTFMICHTYTYTYINGPRRLVTTVTSWRQLADSEAKEIIAHRWGVPVEAIGDLRCDLLEKLDDK